MSGTPTTPTVITPAQVRAMANMPAAVSDSILFPHISSALSDVKTRMGRVVTSADDDADLREAAICLAVSYALPVVGLVYVSGLDRATRAADETGDLMMMAADTERLSYLQNHFRVRAETILARREKTGTAWCEVI